MKENTQDLDTGLRTRVEGMNDSELRMLKDLVVNETNKSQTKRRENLNKSIETFQKGYISSYEDMKG